MDGDVRRWLGRHPLHHRRPLDHHHRAPRRLGRLTALLHTWSGSVPGRAVGCGSPPQVRRSVGLLVEQVYDHQSNVGIGNTTLLAFDAWEHAWYLQYKNIKADYVTALWDIVNWADVAARYTTAKQISPAWPSPA